MPNQPDAEEEPNTSSSTSTSNNKGDNPLKLAEELAGTKTKGFPWYQETFGTRLTPECRRLLEEYSGVPPAEVESHVYKMVRYTLSPLPCSSVKSSESSFSYFLFFFLFYKRAT